MKNCVSLGQVLNELMNNNKNGSPESEPFLLLGSIKFHEMFSNFYRPFVSIVRPPRSTLNGCVYRFKDPGVAINISPGKIDFY